ncbi:hypothetical protein TWF481_005605 [Arthrobotrys musiformis]|uniref:NACHT domain-containing protein n=1 Tax=Arthrobotrys musiformis TaxID=47236 RepID=A0AAV9WFX0_9PEZI
MSSPHGLIEVPDSGSDISDIVVLSRDDVSDYNEHNILPEPADAQKRIREWLEPTGYDDTGSEYKKHLATHLAGTVNWLLSSKAYLKWHSSQEDGLLWIRGIPGSGKSVLAAKLIDQLKQERHPVLYFFFRQIIDANHTAVAAVRDWLDQILVFSPPLQKKLTEYVNIKAARGLKTLSTADLWGLLRLALSHIPKAYVVVDALDEINQNQDLEPFLQSLIELGEWRPSQVKIVITSRPIAYIEGYLRAAKPINIRLEEEKVDVDIATYVRYRLKNSMIPMETRGLIEAAVPGRANGLFLFAKLALDAVLQPDINVETIIQQLPKDLNNIYRDLLRDHSQRTRISDDIQLLILQSVTHAITPLRLLEMADLINTIHEGKRDLKSMKTLVRSACGPLLEILPDETVSVIHHSFTEFLNGSTRNYDSSEYPVLEQGATHNRLALICLSYLKSCLEDPQYDEILNGYKSNKIRLMPPFAQYAARFWHIHVQKSALAGYDQTEIHKALDQFFTGESLTRWTKLTGSWVGRLTPVLAGVTLGLPDYVEYLLSNGSTDFRCKEDDIFSISPLCYAAQKGYDRIVEIILRAGVDPNEKNSCGETALILATSHGHPKIVKLLIEAGVDIFEPVKYQMGHDDGRMSWMENYNESPFDLAGQRGKDDVMAVFFPFIKTPDQANSALIRAVRAKRSPTVKMLLRHPLVDINSRILGQTPLYTACDIRNGGLDIVELLVEAGADPNILSDCLYQNKDEPKIQNGALYRFADVNCYQNYWFPSHNDYLEKMTKGFMLLLAAGAEVNEVGHLGNTVLHKIGEASFARLLLEAGADPNAANEAGQTPLHWCGRLEMLDVLLADPRIEIDRKDNRGRTPLLSMLRRGSTDIVLRLLEAGADATAVDKKGRGAFHQAARTLGDFGDCVSQDTLKRLLESGANINLRNRNGKTALHVLIKKYTGRDIPNRFDEIYDYFLSAGADLELVDNDGKTPLHQFMENCAWENLTERFQRLIKSGARPDTLDYRGRNLYYACLRNADCWEGHGEALKLVLDCNIDPKQTDYDGNTLWHEACAVSGNVGYHYSLRDPSFMLEFLKEKGIEMSQPNKMGRTPLHMVCMFRAYRPNSAVDFLLEQEQIDINQADNNGITALHLASTCCEFHTSRLLIAGAKVSTTTYEGLTALHLAARSRQPNILGILLEALRSQTTADEFLAVVNTKDDSTPKATALYYACASGNPVSVKLLLDAGATVDTPSATGSPWLACARFEEEEVNWHRSQQKELDSSTYRKELHRSIMPDAQGLMVHDQSRSKVIEGDLLPTRLDETVQLLIEYGPSSTKYIDEAITTAASNNFDYTVECLVSKRIALETEEAFKPHLETKLCLVRQEAQRKILENDEFSDTEGLKSNVDFLMSLREYGLVTSILQKVDFLEMDDFKSSILHDLASGGFTFILRSILTVEVLAKLDDWERCRQEAFRARPSYLSPKLQKPKKPLILEVCKGAIPNMDVLRFLVEEVGVDVNTRHIKYVKRGDEWEYISSKSSIRVLITQNRWWQANQAIPYLIQRGANIEIPCYSGITPLHAAVKLDQRKYPFNYRTIKLLLSHGANTDTADTRGRSCLEEASRNDDIFRLLIQHGANVTHQAFLATIKEERYGIFKTLLESGVDPNTGFSPKQEDKHYLDETDHDETFPLHCAACSSGDDHDTRVKMIQLLLDYGADPCAKYPGGTIMHCLVSNSSFMSIFMDLPYFASALEERDSEGNTLLLRACGRSNLFPEPGKPLIEELLDRGADIRARSNDGSTVLHHYINRYAQNRDTGPLNLQLLSLIISKAQDLVNVADKEGRTPLHRVFAEIRRRNKEDYEEAANLLLSAGADPLLAYLLPADLNLPRSQDETFIHEQAGGNWIYSKTGDFNSEKRKLFERLVSMGVDVNVRDTQSETPLFRFFRRANVEQIVPSDPRCACAGAPDRCENIMRAKINELPVLEMFDRAGMDWKAVNKAGETLLHVVASDPKSHWPKRAARRFKFLLEKGLDVTAEDNQHRTALDVAASQGAQDILDLFSRDPQAAEEEPEGLSIQDEIAKLLG